MQYITGVSMVCELQFGKRYCRGRLRKTLQIRGLTKAIYLLSKAIETCGENHSRMFIALNSWFWPVRACLKCLPSDCATGPLCRHVNAPAGVTCTLVVNYTTLQRVTPTLLHCQILSCRHLHALVAH